MSDPLTSTPGDSGLAAASPVLKAHEAAQYRELESCSPEEIAATQNRLLAAHLAYAASSSPFYREWFTRHCIDLSAVRGVQDLPLIPCTEKVHLTEANEAFLAAPAAEIVDVCLTSATTGPQGTQLLQTAEDLSRLGYNEQMAFAMAGVKPDDVLVVCAALDRCFMAGLAYYLGGLALGARLVRAGAGSAAQHWQLLKQTGGTVIVGVPSLMRRIAEYAVERGEDPADMGVRRLVGIGEATRDSKLELLPAARRLEELWGAELFATYASTELATTFCECAARQGSHLRPELLVVEIVDEKQQPLPDGESGEVVVTPLGVKGMPLVRFRTGDVSFLIDKACACGRRTKRLGPILGRKNQMLKFKGTLLFPSMILAVAEGFPGVRDGCVEVRANPDGTDHVAVYLAPLAAEACADRLTEELRARLRVRPELKFIAEDELEQKVQLPGKRKKTTFIDLRSKQ